MQYSIFGQHVKLKISSTLGLGKDMVEVGIYAMTTSESRFCMFF